MFVVRIWFFSSCKTSENILSKIQVALISPSTLMINARGQRGVACWSAARRLSLLHGVSVDPAGDQTREARWCKDLRTLKLTTSMIWIKLSVNTTVRGCESLATGRSIRL